MRFRGFSLIEMLITLAILAIVISHGFRSFSHSRITVEAETDRQHLLRIPVLLDQYYAAKLTYPNRLQDILKSGNSSARTPRGYYLLSYRRESSNSYLLTATLNPRNARSEYVRCAVMTINASGKLAGYDKNGKPANDACWR